MSSRRRIVVTSNQSSVGNGVSLCLVSGVYRSGFSAAFCAMRDSTYSNSPLSRFASASRATCVSRIGSSKAKVRFPVGQAPRTRLRRPAPAPRPCPRPCPRPPRWVSLLLLHRHIPLPVMGPDPAGPVWSYPGILSPWVRFLGLYVVFLCVVEKAFRLPLRCCNSHVAAALFGLGRNPASERWGRQFARQPPLATPERGSRRHGVEHQFQHRLAFPRGD